MEETRINELGEERVAATDFLGLEIDRDLHDRASQSFVGRWNKLVSTTNWEKGRIIQQWRDALVDEEAPATQYSDEAWSHLVGGVTGQHVGRLRRVYQRFGNQYEDYEGLYWSHFQAAIDWDDAEMWLEGAVRSEWSVSRMRRQRWETMGADPDRLPSDTDIVTAELNEDFEPANNQKPVPDSVSERFSEIPSGPRHEGPDFGDAESEQHAAGRKQDESGATIFSEESAEPAIEFVRHFEDLPELPTDLSEAFDQFKLAIIRHKATDWVEISCDDVLATLDALKELAKAPGIDTDAF